MVGLVLQVAFEKQEIVDEQQEVVAAKIAEILGSNLPEGAETDETLSDWQECFSLFGDYDILGTVNNGLTNGTQGMNEYFTLGAAGLKLEENAGKRSYYGEREDWLVDMIAFLAGKNSSGILNDWGTAFGYIMQTILNELETRLANAGTQAEKDAIQEKIDSVGGQYSGIDGLMSGLDEDQKAVIDVEGKLADRGQVILNAMDPTQKRLFSFFITASVLGQVDFNEGVTFLKDRAWQYGCDCSTG